MLNIPLDFSRLKKPIFFEIWHRSFATENDCKIGETEVDLSVLMAVDQIDGWYHIMDGYKNVGQLKVRVFPTENLYEKITGKSRREQLSPKIIYEIPVQKPNEYEERAKFISQNLEYDNDEQIYKRHLQNMRTLENINQNYGSWGQNSGFKTQKPTRHTSPLRRSKEKNHVWDEHQTTHFWTEKLPEISKESDEEWDQNKINQVLKSINEATELDNKAVNNRDTRVKTSRFYPNEILPNVMISNSEISRIAGIMKGQGN